MLLALDIGNSNIVIGASRNGDWEHRWRIQTDTGKTADEYSVLFQSLFREVDLDYSRFNRIIICSVVPQLTHTVRDIFAKRSQVDPLILDHQVNSGIRLKTESPQSVGADLIADAAGAYALFQDDCIVVDFGTATTVMAVRKPGELIGGSICAGLKVTIDALVGKTAQLPQIPMEPPADVIGSNTIKAMQSGMVLGHICMIEGLVNRMKEKLDSPNVNVIATGGLSEIIGPYTDYFDVIDPMLTLNGLRLVMERNMG